MHTYTDIQITACPGVGGDEQAAHLQGLVLDFNKTKTSRTWVRVNFSSSDFGHVLPPRRGTRIQRWWPTGEAPRYQVWYPPNEGEFGQSRTFHGDSQAWLEQSNSSKAV